MRVICEYTVVGPARGESHPPGSTIDLPDSVALALIKNGSVRPVETEEAATAPPPAKPAARAERPAGKGKGKGGRRPKPDADQEPVDDDALLLAILELDQADESLWESDGKPKLEVLAAAVGHEVSGEDRDRAWAEAQR